MLAELSKQNDAIMFLVRFVIRCFQPSIKINCLSNIYSFKEEYSFKTIFKRRNESGKRRNVFKRVLSLCCFFTSPIG